MRVLVLLAMMVTLPGAAAEQQQFDLICTYGQTPVRYRVDLQQGVACEADCSRRWMLGQVSSGEITLKDTRSHYPDEVPQTIVINRQDGTLRHWIGGSGRSYTETASCTAAPFSGFPDRKF